MGTTFPPCTAPEWEGGGRDYTRCLRDKPALSSFLSAAAEEENEEEVELKKSRGVHWEWEGDGGKWIRYSNAHSQKLMEAMTKGDEELTLRVSPGVKMRVRFALMTQTNVSTGWQHDVRCVAADPVHQKQGVWERQDGDGTWVGFSESSCRQLQAAQLCGVEEVMVSVEGKSSHVDLRVMEKEEEKGLRRPVRCVPPDSSTPSGENSLSLDDIHDPWFPSLAVAG